MAKKNRGHGYHGGAWKVAYADFVTAMMALFIVLWILATNTETKAGVAAYFRHPTIFKSGAGFIDKQGMQEYKQAIEKIRAEEAADESFPKPAQPTQKEGPITPEEMAERGVLAGTAEVLEQALNSAQDLQKIRGQVSIEFTPEGMRIQLEDLEAQPLFDLGSPAPTQITRELLTLVAKALATLPNSILVEGHTDARPFSGEGNYSNWELSGDRANAARRILEAGGIDPHRVASVIGYADRRPMLADDPSSQRNRRISIIVCYENAGEK
jgi:chemotaxis protein MotB